jgi:hypothetical protein
MMHEPHIVHFSGHGSKKHKIILGGKPGRGKLVDQDGLVKMFALYKNHVRLVVLNACFTMTQAQSLSEVIDYSVGAGKGIGDKEGVAFAGAFYRALGFGKSVKAAFESAKAELALTRMPRTRGLGLFVRNGVNEKDSFPMTNSDSGGEVAEPGERVSDPFTNHSQHAQAHVFSMRTETNAPAVGRMRLGEKISRPASAGLRKAQRAKRDNETPIQDEIERRSSVSCTRAHVTLTIEVFKVALSDASCTSHTRPARRDQAVRSRPRCANKTLDHGERPESGGSN